MADGGGRDTAGVHRVVHGAGGPGTGTADVTADSGALSVPSSVNGVPDPACLALSPGGAMLCAVSGTAEGRAVAAYRLT